MRYTLPPEQVFVRSSFCTDVYRCFFPVSQQQTISISLLSYYIPWQVKHSWHVFSKARGKQSNQKCQIGN